MFLAVGLERCLSGKYDVCAVSWNSRRSLCDLEKSILSCDHVFSSARRRFHAL